MVVDMLPQPAGMIGGTASGMGPFAQQLQRMFGTTPESRDNFASLMRMFSPPGTNSDADMTGRVLSELAAIDLTAELPRIAAPMTVVFATPRAGASQTPAQVRQTFASAYSRARAARLVAIADSGHMVMLDQPARFNQAVRTFLADS
jgi:pimeloyl-ACP methyl ester carboxylesterase